MKRKKKDRDLDWLWWSGIDIGAIISDVFSTIALVISIVIFILTLAIAIIT